MTAPCLPVPAPPPLLEAAQAPLSVPGNAALSEVFDTLLGLMERAANPASVADLSVYLRSPGVLPAILESRHAPLIGALCVATDSLDDADARFMATQVCRSAEACATLVASPELWTQGSALHITRFMPPDASTESWVRALTSPEKRATLADHGSGLGIGRVLHAVALHLPQDERSEVAVRRLLTADACAQLGPLDKVKAADAVVRHCPPGEDTQALLRNVLSSRGDVDAFTATMAIAARWPDPVRAQMMDALFTADAIETLVGRGQFPALHRVFEALPLLPEGRRGPVAQALLLDARVRDAMLEAPDAAGAQWQHLLARNPSGSRGRGGPNIEGPSA